MQGVPLFFGARNPHFMHTQCPEGPDPSFPGVQPPANFLPPLLLIFSLLNDNENHYHLNNISFFYENQQKK